MKIAAFNVENLFNRAKVLNQDDNSLTSKVSKDIGELNALFDKLKYSDADKQKMIELMKELGLQKSDIGTYVIFRQIREKVVSRAGSNLNIVLDGRDQWVGWVELKIEEVDEIAMMNTGRVIRDVNADVVAVVEVENRIALQRFSDNILKAVNKDPNVTPSELYDDIMVIDGNDERGIDVGLMCKNGHYISYIQSHINDKDASGKKIFSRDCPEYQVFTPKGNEIWVLPNHFKSKFGGDTAASKAKRKAQSERVAQIYKDLMKLGYVNVVVLGDLNDTPDSDPIKPLLEITLKEISTHPTFDPGEYKEIDTYGAGTASNKIDYMLLSPALFSKVTASGLFRKGAFPGKRPKWQVYDTLTEKVHAASDHHVIWVDIDV